VNERVVGDGEVGSEQGRCDFTAVEAVADCYVRDVRAGSGEGQLHGGAEARGCRSRWGISGIGHFEW
jgi:hypothetical protein